MPRTPAEIQADLQANREAIARARVAQSYTVGGNTVQRPDLGKLLDEQKRLEAELQSASAGGVFTRVAFGGAC